MHSLKKVNIGDMLIFFDNKNQIDEILYVYKVNRYNCFIFNLFCLFKSNTNALRTQFPKMYSEISIADDLLTTYYISFYKNYIHISSDEL